MRQNNNQNIGAPQQSGPTQPQQALNPLQPAASTGPSTDAATRPSEKSTNRQDKAGPSKTPKPKAHRHKTRMGFVYALQKGETQRWKIGWVKSRKSLKNHLARLQRNCEERLEVRALKATRMAEKNRLRWDMIMDWCGGDWFASNRQLQQFVEDYPFRGQDAPAHFQESQMRGASSHDEQATRPPTDAGDRGTPGRCREACATMTKTISGGVPNGSAFPCSSTYGEHCSPGTIVNEMN